MHTVSGTGHRPATSRDPDGLTPAQLPWVQAKARAGLEWLAAEHGTEEVWSGMALGWDLILAAAAVDLGLTLRAHVPYQSQPDRWEAEDQAEWSRLVTLAASVHLYGRNPAFKREAVALLRARNDGLLKADGLLACWNAAKRSGGTFSAVKKAARRGLPVVHLDPARQVVHGPGCSCIEGLRSTA
ncbi:hypothetical protein [Dactylosporangium sp. CA-139066]|uniref:hypothetical protein n=1 Tax=Dactylosporangium sp. CA-139066 TaxID=3239930 RepID=UPI003D8D5E97